MVPIADLQHTRAVYEIEYETYLSAERLQTYHNGIKVLSFPQIHSLEGFLRGHPQVFGSLQKGADVLHALEGHLALVDFLHAARFDVVHQSAKQRAVLQDFVEVIHVARCVEILVCDPADPLKDLLCELFAVFGINLKKLQLIKRNSFSSGFDQQ